MYPPPHHPVRSWLMAVLLTLPVAGNGAEAMDFPLYTTAGEQHWLAEYRGRWVVLNYWATWCPPCLEEIPELEIFHQNNHQTRAVVLGLNFENISVEDLNAFLEDNFIDYPIFHQRPRRKTPFGALPGLPTTYVLTPAGVPVAMQAGGITADVLERFITDYEQKHGRQTDPESAGPTTTTAAAAVNQP